MKKIYSLLLVAILTIGAFSASAKTVTLKIDNPGAVGMAYVSNPYTMLDMASGEATATLADTQCALNVTTTSGYEFATCTINSEEFAITNNTWISISTETLNEGDVIEITTRELPAKWLYIVGDPTKISVQDFSYNTLSADAQVDGKWAIKIPQGSYALATINPADGYKLKSVIDNTGKEWLYSSPADNCSISAQSITEDETTVTVETISLDELYPGKIKINVTNGEGYNVSFRFNGQEYSNITLATGENTIRYNPDTDVPFIFSHNYLSYQGTRLYSVKLNGVEVPANEYGYVFITPTSATADVIDIEVDAPAVEIPVTITFEDEGREAINSIYANNQNILKENWDSFTGVSGKSFMISFNTAGYDITKFTINGESKLDKLNYGFYNATCDSETGMDIVIAAKAKTGYKVTIYCENYEGLDLAWDYDHEQPITLTGEETEIEVNPGSPYLYAKANNGFRIYEIYDEQGDFYDPTDRIGIYSDNFIIFEVYEYNRDSKAVVYVDDVEWGNLALTIMPYTDIEARYDFDNGNLATGYNFIAFNEEEDTEFELYAKTSSYTDADVYLNGELIYGNNGDYPALSELKDGDVLKIMSNATASHEVTYTISGINTDDVTVRHDHVNTVDHTATHTVFAGTAVHIVPADGVKVDVKAGDTALQANEDGIYEHTVAGNTNFVITKQSGVESITIDADDANTIYNLQGVRVGTDLNALPAGLYIRGGQKVLKK